MRLIADGGSTKVHWVLYEEEKHISDIFTPGINPSVRPADLIVSLLRQHLIPQLRQIQSIDAVEYYGAGCRGDACDIMKHALGCILPQAAYITVDSDMSGACRAMSEGKSSIVCILGTGANSCLYDGEKIIDNVPPLGYILGDEGSGAWLGKTLLADILKEMLPEEITREFNKRYRLGYDELIRHIYRPAANDPAANGFLASFAPFLSEHINCPEIERIVTTGFNLFFERNIMLYYRRHAAITPCSLPLNFVGSVAASFKPQLINTALNHGLPEPSIRRSPLARHISLS